MSPGKATPIGVPFCPTCPQQGRPPGHVMPPSLPGGMLAENKQLSAFPEPPKHTPTIPHPHPRKTQGLLWMIMPGRWIGPARCLVTSCLTEAQCYEQLGGGGQAPLHWCPPQRDRLSVRALWASRERALRRNPAWFAQVRAATCVCSRESRLGCPILLSSSAALLPVLNRSARLLSPVVSCSVSHLHGTTPGKWGAEAGLGRKAPPRPRGPPAERQEADRVL